MKKRILAIIGLIAYIAFIIWFTVKDLPDKEEFKKKMEEKNQVLTENIME